MIDDKKKRASSVNLHAVIDRIEDGGMAVILVGDDEKIQLDLPVSLLPREASDGDHLRITIKLDRESRASAEDRIDKLRAELEQRSASPDRKNFKL
ncbi:MAG TPA: DUF3006 domain-containing protein [Pyrinomonadaceae bacterium]|nr:DUF3006 domain-containing protein [Pyrinomonadaceae bacterium]